VDRRSLHGGDGGEWGNWPRTPAQTPGFIQTSQGAVGAVLPEATSVRALSADIVEKLEF
jgi:hypothetical protein